MRPCRGLVADQGLREGDNTGHLTPGAKSGGTGRTIIGGGKAMAAKLEVVVDATMGGEKTLRLTG